MNQSELEKSDAEMGQIVLSLMVTAKFIKDEAPEFAEWLLGEHSRLSKERIMRDRIGTQLMVMTMKGEKPIDGKGELGLEFIRFLEKIKAELDIPDRLPPPKIAKFNTRSVTAKTNSAERQVDDPYAKDAHQ